MSVIQNFLLATPEGYQISRSVRLRSSASAYLSRTPGSSSGQQTFTISTWGKRGTLGSEQVVFGINSAGTNIFTVAFLSGNTLRVFGRNAGSDVLNITTTAVYRDPSSWYHIVVAIDTTQATAANRARLYVNGVEVTAFSTATYPAQNTSLAWNSSSYAHDIGRESTGNYFDGYLTEINHISGLQLTPSSFGETNPVTGVWQPKKYAGTYGTNGFYLNFSDNSAATAAAIGKDYSGNGNNWTPNNISVTAGVTYDSMLDVPTQWADGGNGRGNYTVMNPLDVISGSNAPTYSNGNLTLAIGNSNHKSRGTIGASSGKYYFEFGGTNVGGIYNTIVVTGIINESGTDWRYVVYDGTKTSGGVSGGAYGTGYGSGAWPTIGCAIDLDSGKIWFRNDSGWYASGDPAAGTNAAYTNVSGTVRPYFEGGGGGYSGTIQFNFGQRPFAYTPPTGFKALNTQNLPQPTILKGNQYFDATTYSGQNTSLSVTNSGSMQPDLVWIKKRNGATDHNLTDAVRGTNKNLISNSTAAEDTTARLTSFNSNGFTLAGAFDNTNISGSTYVGWQWKEGATQGFDIVTWTGTGAAQNISHNLGVAPAMIIWKYRSAASDWAVGHKLMNGGTNPWNYWAALNSTAAQAASAGPFNNTAPTSSQFTVGSFNANGVNMVAYLFSEVAGFSKFGSYTGNGSADGTFVYTGFRPRFVMVKASSNSTAATTWTIWDTQRSPSNASVLELFANSAVAEATDTNGIDILSNGFKPRRNSEYANTNGWTYIYAAFAEHPFKNALAR